MRFIHKIALVLVIIGAINWGLIGLFRFDLVAAIFGGQDAFLSRVIYSLVGLSGLICISLLFAPMRKEEKDVNRQGTGNLNYATEFGEETDLSKLKKD
ncbi:DUF378 domain-containing protein [Neobacillus sp. OS1-2]|uniref:DUF378 domain-containing protein n=1 Tax=Neobacillus sp. OS1-2 TaxID=3070680 RepID=UPI0027DECA26|nr:DUF378 domain-containing protein [Neobacillus sp. OS1-2]WML39761.1 DUF378 domain-containing protein [Neobacillus sp. OS1-2]